MNEMDRPEKKVDDGEKRGKRQKAWAEGHLSSKRFKLPR
jgi:hypothetical protein